MTLRHTTWGHSIFWLIILCCLLLGACQAEGGAVEQSLIGTSTDTTQGEATDQVLKSQPARSTDETGVDATIVTTTTTITSNPPTAQTAEATASTVGSSATLNVIENVYLAQSGDTLEAVAARFGVSTDKIRSPQALEEGGLLPAGQILNLPGDARKARNLAALLPDTEVVYSPAGLDFRVDEYLALSGGILMDHQEYLKSTGWTSAAAIIDRVALENSINPRVLLALLEYRCGCVRGGEADGDGVALLEEGYALGVEDFLRKGLYGQMWWAANKLSTGYYGWRDGSLVSIVLPDGKIYQPAPDWNAGSVAVAYLYAQMWQADLGVKRGDFERADWMEAVNPEGFARLYREMFPDVEEGVAEENGLPGGLQQPALILPFEPGVVWSYASGPHAAWQSEGALAALDFAPSSNEGGCVESREWVVAMADGSVVRSAHGAVVQDLDHDGKHVIVSDMDERTGWAILYMHIAEEGRVAAGTYLKAGDRIGHPSCEGGPSTGTHVHIARKYNGEWIAADGPIPFVMDGWTAHAGEAPYKGTLTKGNQELIANTSGVRTTQLSRQIEE